MTPMGLVSSDLERVYRKIQRERMSNVPVLNPHLSVKAVGFQPWNEHLLGILVTPWFMNLMLLPREGERWVGMQQGAKVIHQFPSGPYEFIFGEEAAVGCYQSCSLFSPMFEFHDQQSAEITAERVLQGIMEPENCDGVYSRESEIVRTWRGEETPNQTTDKSGDSVSEGETLAQRMNRPVSRREMLSGLIPDDQGQ